MRIFLSGVLICAFSGLLRAAGELPAAAAGPGNERAATLVNLIKDVLVRRTGSSDWGKGTSLMDLFERDTVYTMADSRAEVRFHTGESLVLTPNTLVVLRPPGKKAAEAVMLSGELFSKRSRVVTRGAVIRPGTADTEFSARLKEGLTTVVSVTRGVAEVEAHGRKVLVRKGYVTEVKPDMAPSAPVELAAPGTGADTAGGAPALGAAPPAAGSSMRPDALDSVNMLSGYQLQVAKDRDFTAVVLDRTCAISEKPDLAKLLPPGEYFMRVAKIDLLGYKGRFSAPRPIKI